MYQMRVAMQTVSSVKETIALINSNSEEIVTTIPTTNRIVFVVREKEVTKMRKGKPKEGDNECTVA